MRIVFYITNHGYGHASRNVPIIQELIKRRKETEIVIKSDKIRTDFLKRNLADCEDHIHYFEDCRENGFLLKDGRMEPDIEEMEKVIRDDLENWDRYIAKEVEFLNNWKPDLVFSDIVPWALKAANICQIRSLLAGNFLWSEMYKTFFGKDIWKPYEDCYKMADQALWYELHPEALHYYCANYECVSLISRTVNYDTAERIKERHKKPMVFISLGGSAALKTEIDVSGLPYDFAVTAGIKLSGDNVYNLPMNMINTPDYIAASDYVIAKGGWSTVAEILLQKKKCALLFRGNNPEDDSTKGILEERGHCVMIEEKNLFNIRAVLARLDGLNSSHYDIYVDDTKKICDRIMG